MSSFLEKLQRGMAPQNSELIAKDNPASEEVSGDVPPQDGDAVFAAHKTKPLLKKSGIPSLEEKDPAKRIITAENIDQATATDDDKNNSVKKSAQKPAAKPKKNMPNKKISAQEQADREWLPHEGQLAVNVYQTDNELVIQSAIAGVKSEDLEVVIEDDVVIIKGSRANPLSEEGNDYFIEECHWGSFSRKIIVPVEVDSGRADAALKDGILTIRIPKIQREKKKKILVKEKTA